MTNKILLFLFLSFWMNFSIAQEVETDFETSFFDTNESNSGPVIGGGINDGDGDPSNAAPINEYALLLFGLAILIVRPHLNKLSQLSKS